jgi:CRP-like cAMP-binding protein
VCSRLGLERAVSNRPTNLLLASLSAADLKLLEPHLRLLDLQQQKILFEAGESVSTVYFPYDAVISLVVAVSTGETVEAAMVGRDGVVGAAAALDGNIAISRAIVQISGHGASCDVEVLKRAAMQSTTLHSLLIRHEQVVYAQAQQTAACNGLHSIEERLARWLLMADDRAGGETVQLTHEFLALMLGARRAGVTNALSDFQKRGILSVARASITIRNRKALEDAANGSYGVPEAEYNRLFES